MAQDRIYDEIVYYLGNLNNLYVLNLTSYSINSLNRSEDYKSIKILKNGLIVLGGQTYYDLTFFNFSNNSVVRTQNLSFHVTALEEINIFPSNVFLYFIKFFFIKLNLHLY